MRRGEEGFTLLEMLVVIVIAGLLAALIVSRGPLRSRALAFASLRGQVEGALDQARARAVSGGEDVEVRVDGAAHVFVLSAGAAVWRVGFDPKAAITLDRPVRFGAAGGMAGGASGGPVTVVFDGRRCVFDLSALTGRVVAQPC